MSSCGFGRPLGPSTARRSAGFARRTPDAPAVVARPSAVARTLRTETSNPVKSIFDDELASGWPTLAPRWHVSGRDRAVRRAGIRTRPISDGTDSLPAWFPDARGMGAARGDLDRLAAQPRGLARQVRPDPVGLCRDRPPAQPVRAGPHRGPRWCHEAAGGRPAGRRRGRHRPGPVLQGGHRPGLAPRLGPDVRGEGPETPAADAGEGGVDAGARPAASA